MSKLIKPERGPPTKWAPSRKRAKKLQLLALTLGALAMVLPPPWAALLRTLALAISLWLYFQG